MGLVVAVCMILAALFLVRSEWEKLQLDTVRYRIPAEKLTAFRETDGEPKLRLLFISDLHEYLPAEKHPELILAAIDRESPDAVLIGGDMITVSRYREYSAPHTESTLNLIRKIAEKYPVFYGEGNHESRLRVKNSSAYAAYVEALLKAGVRYLADNSIPLALCSETSSENGTQETKSGTYRETGITVTGISLEEQYYEPNPGFGLDMQLPENYLEEKLPQERGNYQILLLHSPAFLQEAAEAGADLVLSGHMHGGTVRLPGGSGLMTPQYRFFVKECSGMFTRGKTSMIVTRGLGTHSIRLRINNLPELTVIDLVPAEKERKDAERTDQLQAGKS